MSVSWSNMKGSPFPLLTLTLLLGALTELCRSLNLDNSSVLTPLAIAASYCSLVKEAVSSGVIFKALATAASCAAVHCSGVILAAFSAVICLVTCRGLYCLIPDFNTPLYKGLASCPNRATSIRASGVILPSAISLAP